MKGDCFMTSIQIGVCGWGDHDLYPPQTASKDKLAIYAGHFPIVELDSTFHAIAPAERIEKWCKETPKSFQFIVKPYRELTGHGRPNHAPERTWEEMVEQVKASFEPMRLMGKCTLVLFQFPPWYDCTKSHVRYIRRLREAFKNYTIAVEFRNQTWFREPYREQTLSFLQKEQIVHVVCDEPQAGMGSVPIVLEVTHPSFSMVRFHGRNQSGWNQSGAPNWRDIRYAYQYSDAEIAEWVPRIQQLATQTEQVFVLFNNNSQGHAVESARKMIQQLGLTFDGLAPRQLSLQDWMDLS